MGSQEQKEAAKRLYEKGFKVKNIAEQLHLSYGTVYSWKNRGKWKHKSGAPIGNKNAAGHVHIRATGNRYAVRHGAYSKAPWGALEGEETPLEMPYSVEDMLEQELSLCEIRERRLMIRCRELYKRACEASPAQTIRTENVRTFKSKEDEEKYLEAIKDRERSNARLPGDPYTEQSTSINNDNLIIRFEDELSRVQALRVSIIISLHECRRGHSDQLDGKYGLAKSWIKSVSRSMENQEGNKHGKTENQEKKETRDNRSENAGGEHSDRSRGIK